MSFVNLLKPLFLAAMLGLLGFLVLGGQIWMWILAAWLGSAPVIVWWNWRSKTSDRFKDSAPSAVTKTSGQMRRDTPALASTSEPSSHKVHNRFNKDLDVGRD